MVMPFSHPSANRILPFTLLIALVVGPTMDGAAKVMGTTLRNLAASADLIVVGRVTNIIAVQGVPVAEVEVAETLKGRPHKRIYYLAQSTWTCDITSAKVGETTLFFFKRYRFDPHPSTMAYVSAERPGVYWIRNGTITGFDYKEPPGFREEITKVVGSSAFMTVHWAGRGQMPIREVRGIKYVMIWTGDVALPPGVETIAGPEPQYSGFIRSVQLSTMVELIRSQLD